MQIKTRRLFALFLAFVLALGMFPATVFAAEDPGSDQSTDVPEESATDPPTDPVQEEIDIESIWAEIAAALPEAYYDPSNPDNPYPRGIPVDNFFPEEFYMDPSLFPSLYTSESQFPANMWNNDVLDALSYLGYNVQWLKDNGVLYDNRYIAGALANNASHVLTDIGYSSSVWPDGNETVADSSTATGLAPNVSRFESYGLCCASFVAYYYTNYLPNIKGVDTSIVTNAVMEEGYDAASDHSYLISVGTWLDAMNELANTEGSGVTRYTSASTAYANLEPGDLIIFRSNDGTAWAHCAIYLGRASLYSGTANYGTYTFIAHVGNRRGPEISVAEYMNWEGGDKESVPYYWYHIDWPDPLGDIEVYKKDGNGNALAGAQFLATNTETGKYFNIGPTDENGYASTGKNVVPYGTYKVVETVFPKGYQTPAGKTNEWTVTVGDETPTVKIDAVNELIPGYIKIEKETEDGQNLTGWNFKVTNTATGAEIGTYTITSGNSVTVGPLPANVSYTVTEIVPADSSYEPETNPQSVTVKPGETATVKFVNKLKYGVGQIIKETTNGGSKSGWQFTVKNSAGTTIGTYTTDANGVIALDLLPGVYTVTESSTTYEYWRNDPIQTKTLTVEAGKTKSVTFKNEYFGKGQIVKETTNGGSKAGWVFEVKNDSGTVIGTYTTPASGIITLDLEPGTYTVTESSTTYEYWRNDPTPTKQLVVEAGKTKSVTFKNEYFGKGQIVKTATNNGSVEGWTFEVKNDSGTLIGTYTTPASGVIVLDLEPGDYSVTETNAAKDYWHNDPTATKPLTITAGQTATVTFTNEYVGKGKIVKETSNGGSKAGWTFEIKNASGTVVATRTTDASGVIILDLEPGTYKVKETNPSYEYWINDTEEKTLTVTAGATASVSFSNEYRGKIQVTKTTNTGNDLNKWRFGIYTNANCTDASLVEIVTTDANGIATSGLLNPGTYFVKELDRGSAGGYLSWALDTSIHTVTVVAGKTENVSVRNNNYGRIQMVKTTNTGVDLGGWLIGVYTDAACEDPIAGSPFVTDANGVVYTTADSTADSKFLPLEPGMTYYVKELGRQDGNETYWVLDTTVHAVTIQASQTHTVTFHNIHRGLAKMVKTTNTGVDLDGWIIDIYADEALTNKVGELTTNDTGNAELFLEPGTYWFMERSNGDPYWICDTAPRSAEIKPGADTTVNFANSHMGRIQIVKTMDTDGPVDGWQFKITDEAGNEIPGSHFTTVATEIGGKTVGLILTDLLEPGKYIVEELFPADSLYYCKSVNPQTITVLPGATTETSFVNALRPGKITVDKVNWAGEYLAGATFLLEWSEDGQTWYPVTYSDKADVVKGGSSNADLVAGCVTTDDTGKLEFGNLYPGIQYRLTEVEAPEGYILLADYAYEGTLPVKDLTISLTVHNSKGYILPTTGSVGIPMATGGMLMVLLALAALLLLLFPPNTSVIPGGDTAKNNRIKMKGKGSIMKKQISRIFSLVLALVLLVSLAAPAFAAESADAVIDENATGSMTIYKIDFTNAEKDGVWDHSYVSTGVYDEDVNDTLINEAVRDGDTDTEATLGNGDTSYGYAIKGVEFTYLRVAKIRTYSEAEEVVAGKYHNHTEVLYGIPANDEILTILGLDKDDRYAPADIDGENIWYYQSDVLIYALKTKLANQPTDTKNKLEAYITANGGTAMPETNAYGKTSADNLPLGLYLVLETGLPQQVSSSVDPFLVSLPMTSVDGGNANDGGTRWIYNVTLYPKNTTSISSLEKTVREAKADGGKNGATETITDGFAHTATASSGDTVEFQIISTLPTITSDVTALTAYGFEDTMAAGLRYNQDTVKLEWFKDKACTEKIASWTVNGDKFKATFGVNGDKSTMTIEMTDAGLEEINHSDAVYAADTVRRGYSDMTLRITYTAELESDDTLIFGEKGNENVVFLKWQRTNGDYFDTLVDDCHIYAFGIDLTKEFSDGRGDYTAVTFVVFNETDGQWVQAAKDDATGIYYMTGWVTDEANATVFTPTDTGKLIIKGLEDDTYILTETNTDNGYTLLKDHITVEITVAEKDVCGIYETDTLGLVQNDPRFQGVADGLYHNMPQVALSHKTLTAAATVDGNAVTMLPDDTSAQAFAPLTVVNTHGFNLPQTGEFGAVMLPLVGIFTMVAACFVILMVMPHRKEEI